MTKRKIITFCGITLIVLAVVTGFSYQRTDRGSDMLPVVVETFEIHGGWGYKVKVDGHNYIYQDVIPGIAGNRPFQTKENAQRVGDAVVQKLIHHKNPSMTQAELLAMQIPEAQ
jgi:hypothetical protein